jgi:hypothetical protein
MIRYLILALALVAVAPAIQPAQAEGIVITDKMVGLVIQCGQAIITITPDKKLQSTGLPPGDYPLDVKDARFISTASFASPFASRRLLRSADVMHGIFISTPI